METEDKSIDTYLVSDTVRSFLPKGRKQTSKGWETFNCVMCHVNGEPTRDNKRKGAIMFDGPSFTYKCWRCKFKATYRPGMQLSKSLMSLFEELGVDEKGVLNLKLHVMNLKQRISSGDFDVSEVVITSNTKDFPPIKLPKGSFDIATHEGGDNLDNDEDFLKALFYLESLGEQVLNYPVHYTQDNSETPIFEMHKRIILPFYYKDDIVGYTARYYDRKAPENIPKYVTQCPDDFLFNNKFLMDWNRKYAVLVEGPMDAIPINGIAYLKDTLTKGQINWINSSGKEIILVPDRGESAGAAVQQAIEQHWYVSMPSDWDRDIKDVHDAYKKYGALFTLEQIIDAREHDPVKINMAWKKWK